LIKIDYSFEKQQMILFRVEDADEGGKTELVGAVEVQLGTLLSS